MRKLSKRLIIVLICVLIASIIITTICIVVLKKKIRSKQEVHNNYENDGIGYVADKSFKEVTDYSMYFTVKNIISDYVANFENINGDVDFEMGRIQMSEEEVRRKRFEKGMKAITESFDEQYKKAENYDEQDIKSYAEKYKNTSGNLKYKLIIKEMYKASIDPGIVVVIVYTKLNDIDFNCMIKMNTEAYIYSVFWDDYLDKYNYTKERTEDIKIDTNIEKGNYNTFVATYPNEQYIAVQYFENIKDLVQNDPKELYNILDEQYKNDNFSEGQKFVDFVKSLREKIKNAEPSKYKFDDQNIIIVDSYNTIYKIKSTSIMKYTVEFDEYDVENTNK